MIQEVIDYIINEIISDIFNWIIHDYLFSIATGNSSLYQLILHVQA